MSRTKEESERTGSLGGSSRLALEVVGALNLTIPIGEGLDTTVGLSELRIEPRSSQGGSFFGVIVFSGTRTVMLPPVPSTPGMFGNGEVDLSGADRRLQDTMWRSSGDC